MKRLIVLLLLALPALGVTVPCTPSVNGIYLVPPRPGSTEPVLLRVGTRVPGKATFGDPTIEYLSFKRIIVTLPVSRMPYDVPDIETCDVQVLPVPEPLRPGVVYSVSVDYGGSVLGVSADVIYDEAPPAMEVVPAAPKSWEAVAVVVSGITPNLSSSTPPHVHVEGGNIDIELDVYIGQLTLVGRYREIAVLPPLAAGTYLVTATVRRFMGFGWLRSYNRTQSMLTVVADAPRLRPSRH